MFLLGCMMAMAVGTNLVIHVLGDRMTASAPRILSSERKALRRKGVNRFMARNLSMGFPWMASHRYMENAVGSDETNPNADSDVFVRMWCIFCSNACAARIGWNTGMKER